MREVDRRDCADNEKKKGGDWPPVSRADHCPPIPSRPHARPRGSGSSRELFRSSSAIKNSRLKPLPQKPGPNRLHSHRQQLLRFGLDVEHDLVVDRIPAHAPAVDQLAEQQFVGQRPLDLVLQPPRHRPRAHQRVEAVAGRSEERSVGKEGVSTWRTRGWPYPSKQNKHSYT